MKDTIKKYSIYCNKPTQLTQYEALFEKLYEAENGGKLDQIRAERAKEWLSNLNYCGRFGVAEEILQARKRQKKINKSPENITDNTVKFLLPNGKTVDRNLESKENGGRITAMLTDTKDGKKRRERAEYVAYTLRILAPISSKKKQQILDAGQELPWWILPTKLIPKDLFIQKIIEFGAYKVATDKNLNPNGYQIQPTNKALHEWLTDYPVEYNRNWIYQDWEFDGVE